MKDGETTVIGGIITDQQGTTVRGIPYLSKIPVLGWLFKRTNRTDDYLLGMPLLPDYLEEALDRLGYSVEDAEDDSL